ncbi:DUF779 domain-containing protein [Actinomycetospora sp.]|jgi:hypothetical protein|uniref:DUF779 domain-containing protein n=1 Tax=Actinomycetospora sp. TaxID=1872135 RepID=UPI002F4237DE
MTEPMCRIDATAAAIDAMDQLAAEHGELVLHIPGGAEEAGTPMCFGAGELRVGARDVFLGTAHGVEVYEQASRPDAHFRAGWDAHLDVVPGRAPGFSLHPEDGMRFTIHDSRPADHRAGTGAEAAG